MLYRALSLTLIFYKKAMKASQLSLKPTTPSKIKKKVIKILKSQNYLHIPSPHVHPTYPLSLENPLISTPYHTPILLSFFLSFFFMQSTHPSFFLFYFFYFCNPSLTDPLPSDRKSAGNSTVTSQPSSLDRQVTMKLSR